MTLRFREKLLLVQGSKFLLVGVMNAVIGLGIIYSCYNLLGVDYRLSNILGYGCGIANSFIWNRRWTFKSKKNPAREILFFFVMFGISYGINLGVTVLLVEKAGVGPNIAQLFGIAGYTISNFFGNKYITFR